MAFPTVVTTSTYQSGVDAVTHTITLPTGIVAGNLLLVFTGNDGAADTASVTTPASGWTSLGNAVANALGDNGRGTWFYRWADGAEAATIVVTITSTESVAALCYRITGADPATNPEMAGVAGPSSTANPDPPNLDPAGWAAEDTLWIASYCWDADISHTSYPANYTANQLTNRVAAATGFGVAAATRELNASAEDPGTGTISASEQWAAFTVAVRPAPPQVPYRSPYRQLIPH